MGNPRRAAPIGRGIPVDRSVGAADNDFLQYNATSRKWEFVTAGEAGLLTAAANETITGDWIFQDQITIQDTGGTDSVLMQHNGTNFGMSFTNTSLWDVNLAGTNGVTFSDAGNAKFWVNLLNSRVEVHDGWPLRVYDSADTDYIDISDDGTLTRFTSNPNIMAFYPEGSASAKFSIRSAYAGPQGGAALRVWDAGSTDYAEFSHDGTDFNTDFTNTSDWNMSGLGNIITNAVSVRTGRTGSGTGGNVQFYSDDGTRRWLTGIVGTASETSWSLYDLANSHEVIEVTSTANTTDKILRMALDGSRVQVGGDATGRAGTLGTTQHTDAAGNSYRMYVAYDSYWDEVNDQWVANRTTLGRKFKMEMGYHKQAVTFSYFDGTVSSPWADSAWTDMLVLDASTSQVDINTGWKLRIWDATDADYMAMSHNGTDFLIDFANTTWFRIGNSTPPTSGTLFRGGQDVRIYDSADNDYIAFRHDGTDAYIDVHQTTDVEIDAAANATGKLKFQGDDVHAGDFRMKDADLSRASTTTQTADDDLIGFSFTANSLYAVEIMLLVQSASATPMFKWDFSFTNAPQDSGGGMHYFGGGAFGEQTNGDLTTDYLVTNNYTDEACIHFKGYVLTNATTGGTASFRWSQRVSSGTSTTLRRGSWVKFTKL